MDQLFSTSRWLGDRAIVIGVGDDSGRGNAYNGKGDLNQAVVNFSKAIELNPRYAEGHYYRALAYDSLGQKAKVKAGLQKYEEMPQRE
jgi:tetratricopeptide (TPR) repeat protein